MTDHIETLRATMIAFGYREERIDAALSALTSDFCTETQQTEDPYMSPRKLCKYLDISGTTLWRHNPPFHRIGGRKRYLLNEVVAHMGVACNKRSATEANTPASAGMRCGKLTKQPGAHRWEVTK